jgi:signal transduction histidine kinase
MAQTEGIPMSSVSYGGDRRPMRLWLQAALGVFPIAMAITGVLLARMSGRDYPDAFGLTLLPSVVAFAVGGAVLLSMRRARPTAIVLLAGAMFGAVTYLSDGVNWQVARSSWWITADVGTVTSAAGWASAILCVTIPIVLLPQVFPDGVIRRWWARVLFGLSLALLATVAAVTIADETMASGLADDFWDEFGPIGFILITVFGCGVGLVCLVVRFAASPPLGRRQILAFGLVHLALNVCLVINLSSDVELPSWTFDLVFVGWTVGVLGSILLGVARYQLYEVRIVVRRVALYTATTVVLTGVFVVVYLLLSAVLSQSLSTVEYGWVAVVAAVVVVLLVEPVRRRLVDRLGKRFLGDRRQPLEAFARLSLEKDGHDASTTLTAILQALITAVRAPGAALCRQDGSQMRTVAALGSPGGDPLVLPVAYRGELLGQLQVGRRTPGEDYPRADRVLLEQLVAQAAAQMYGVRRDEELSQVRREALTAIADERARLGRDLHDGLAPLLAGAGLTAEALRRDLTPSSAGEQEAARLAERLRHAAGEVRSIAHGLDPGELSVSLDEAVDNYLGGLSGPGVPTFTAHLDIDHLPPVVAQAAYLVVLEAVNNVIQHAAARQMEVTVQREADNLILQVADDGRGITQPYVSGLGITSMRRRIEALGGIFTIAAQPTGGTRIHASIPVNP